MTITDDSIRSKAANVALVRRFFACFAERDLVPLSTEILAPDVVWHVPGRHPLAGTHHGPEQVVAFFTELARSGFQAEILFLQADEHRVVEVHRGWSGRQDGTDIDLTWVLVFDVENGRVVQARNFVSDQAAADTFFSAAYQLAPLPARLAVAHSGKGLR
ncbi:nuclear transport factor 2 family protein [Krasilnikovia sp. MM14-A1259]|uniref:nuclear transport factor 2 family protein n=1 Tax=Krasilnikovia sp. MM14-A1259 TaxID=3373539 RepID=UPI003821FEA5